MSPEPRLAFFGKAALDLVLPPQCVSCGAVVAVPGQFCAACFQTLGFIGEPVCRQCGLPFGSGESRVCAQCVAYPPPWRQARAALVYDAPARALILALKHADRQENAVALALHMARAGAGLLADAEVLVPVPLHRRRLLHRRYNQAALLARAVGRRAGVAVAPDALRRLRRTAPLGAYAAAERAEMMQGVIAMRPSRLGRVVGRRVVLIDDVMTSGATAGACTRALLDAGAARVDVLVASRVPDPRVAAERFLGSDDADD